MSGISTHVLDLALGCPAAGVRVTLMRLESGEWSPVAASATDRDGRCRELLRVDLVSPGTYRIVFETGPYLALAGVAPLYPEVSIAFQVLNAGCSYHMPLLLSPNGYTTYRGS